MTGLRTPHSLTGHYYCSAAATDQRFHAYDFATEKHGAPDDLKDLVDSIESIPWRRRDFERRAMLEEMLERAGPEYKKRFLACSTVGRRPDRSNRRVSAVSPHALFFDSHRW